VLTGKPNYPGGKPFEGYSADGCSHEEFLPGVKVFRAPLRPRYYGGAKNMILNYLSFVFNGIFYFYKDVKGESFDVVFVFGTSPITAAIPAILIKLRLRSHLAIWIQDLSPDDLKATGYITNRFLLWLAGLGTRSIYFFADTLLVQSRAFKTQVSRYASAKKILYYPNSFPDLTTNDKTINTRNLNELLSVLEKNFCIVFAGNIGRLQSVETIVEFAERLKTLPNVKLILVGSGSMSSWLESKKNELALDNLILAGRYPMADMPQIFSRASALLVTLKRDNIFSYLALTVPSKIQAYLAAGRPIIAALDGEGARIIEEAKAGLTCPAEDVSGLLRCVEQLYTMPDSERIKLGKAGRKYFLDNFEMENQARKLVEILSNRITSDK
jgi:glycosyltransferase involved in cell wall biosynthesis